MPKPDVKVLLELADAYLAERKSTWGIEVLGNSKLKLPTNNKWVEDKIEALYKILQQIVKADHALQQLKTTEEELQQKQKSYKILQQLAKVEEDVIDNWIALAFHIHAEEQNENAKLGLTTVNHLLLDLFRAMRSYIVNSIKEIPDFIKKFAALKNSQKTHEDTLLRLDKFTINHDPNERVQANMELFNTNKQIDSLTVESNYLAQYVNLVIAPNEKYKKLNVIDYKTFIEAIVSNPLPPAELCMQLIDTKNIVISSSNNNSASATKAPVAAISPEAVAPVMMNVTDQTDKPQAKSSATKTAEGASALVKNSLLSPSPATTAPKAPRKGKGKPMPQPIPLSQFTSDSESPDRDIAVAETPAPNASRSTRSGRNY